MAGEVFQDNAVVSLSLVPLMKLSAKNPPLRQAPKRCASY